MARLRYWKISAEEMGQFKYPPESLVNWDIKCVREPEDEARFFGVFLYRNGTPFDYDPVKGIVYYYNNISRDELPSITKFLKKKYGGKEEAKGERIFLKGSEEIYSAGELAGLAKDLESSFKTRATLTLEFVNLTEQDAKEAGLPEAKLLPIPGT